MHAVEQQVQYSYPLRYERDASLKIPLYKLDFPIYFHYFMNL